MLEIGTGSGYQTAMLASWPARSTRVERVKPLLDEAFERLLDLGVRNVHFRHGDGTLGWPEAAPFDRILDRRRRAGAAAEAAARRNSTDGGIAVLPIGPQDEQMLVEVTPRGDEAESPRTSAPAGS